MTDLIVTLASLVLGASVVIVIIGYVLFTVLEFFGLRDRRRG